MPPPRRAQKRKAQARRVPLASIAEESRAPTSREESGAETRDELHAVTGREERLASRLARHKYFTPNPGSFVAVHEFQRALSGTKAALAQFEADLTKLRRVQSQSPTPPAPPTTTSNPAPDLATPFPLIPIPIPPPSVVQQIERGWIPYYSDPPAGVSLQYIDGAGRPVAHVSPHLYFPWPAPPPVEHDAEDDGGDGHYYYPYFALPPQGW